MAASRLEGVESRITTRFLPPQAKESAETTEAPSADADDVVDAAEEEEVESDRLRVTGEMHIFGVYSFCVCFSS